MSGSSVRIWLSGWAILQASDVRVAGLTTVPQPARQPSRRQWRRAAVSGPPLDAASLLPKALRLRRSSCPAWLVMVEQGCRVAHAADRYPGRVHRHGREELGESAAVDPDVPPVGITGRPSAPVVGGWGSHSA